MIQTRRLSHCSKAALTGVSIAVTRRLSPHYDTMHLNHAAAPAIVAVDMGQMADSPWR